MDNNLKVSLHLSREVAFLTAQLLVRRPSGIMVSSANCYAFGPGFQSQIRQVAAVAEWSRNRIVAGLVTSSSPVPLKTHPLGKRCTLNLLRAQTSSRGCGVVVRRGGAS
ncbi:uncharacterized protein TNCV_1496921 [Trichonephila clavipes]|nr:uncharacterized protein TNCV_1496921 [Trichonephila clavipes]